MNINFIWRWTTIKHGQNFFSYKSIMLDKKLEYTFKRYKSNYCSIFTVNLTSNDKNQGNLFYNNNNNNVYQNNVLLKREYCTNEGPLRRLPPLMKFPEIVWPSLWKSLRNFILTNFIIKPYFDREFNLPDFILGTKKAVEVVSNKLSGGDIQSLNGLVTKDILPELQKTISQMSLSQRQQITINREDMYFSFPYQIGIMFDDDNNTQPQKRYVEITMVYHVLRGLDAMKTKGEDLPLNVGMLPQYRDNISICNYRFIKEFTKGAESDWSINLLNHFKPSDYIDQ